jgi:mannose-6-phosphate isomerase-like protein (cupin superfamily)
MERAKTYIISNDEIRPDDVGDAEGFRGVDIRWLITNGTVGTNHSTLFHVVFPTGAYHGPHWHNNTDELLFTVRGHAVQWVDGEICHMTPGTAMYIPKGVIHWMRNDGDEEVEVIGFYPDVRNYADSDQRLCEEPEKYGFVAPSRGR